MGAGGRQRSDISEERPFGLARMQSIIQAGYGVVHCIRANVNMIPYPMWNSSYVVIPLKANITRERNHVKLAFLLFPLKPVLQAWYVGLPNLAQYNIFRNRSSDFVDE